MWGDAKVVTHAAYLGLAAWSNILLEAPRAAVLAFVCETVATTQELDEVCKMFSLIKQVSLTFAPGLTIIRWFLVNGIVILADPEALKDKYEDLEPGVWLSELNQSTHAER